MKKKDLQWRSNAQVHDYSPLGGMQYAQRPN